MKHGKVIRWCRIWLYMLVLLPFVQLQISASQTQSNRTHGLGLPRLVGRQAPEFLVRRLDGKEVSLSDFQGKALLVNFWATWCGACKLEMPWLAELRDQYKHQGFEVLGILTDSASPGTITSILRRYGVTYPIVMCNHRTAQAYGGLPYLPTSFLIDRKGRVIAEIADAGSKEELAREIRKALAQ